MIAITYINHATTLIENDGKFFLTDPFFDKRLLCFFKRHSQTNYDPGALPKLSGVLISHAHYDHLDINSFRYISCNVPVFVPVGLGKFLGRFLRNPIIELAHWSAHKLADGTEVTATEAKHTGFRASGLRFHTCNGYVINNRVFFAGDTGYGPHFKEIGTMFGKDNKLEVALLPIGGYSPSFVMKKRHLSPDEAIEAFLDTGAKHFVPIHFGTFRLSAEPINEPAEKLARLTGERNLDGRIHILSSGEHVSF